MTDVRPHVGERQGTVWVIEDEPPATRPRWYAHWDGTSATSFDSLEDAVSWGLERARTIIVRTLGDAVYWAGERPTDWKDDHEELRPWPPSTAERLRIDTDYEAAVMAASDDEAARQAYEREREEVLAVRAPGRAGRKPFYECLLLESEYEEIGIEFEELAPEVDLYGARGQRSGRHGFGSPEAAIAAAAGRDISDPWVLAVCTALGRQREWPHRRRTWLAVQAIDEDVFHVTATANRESISTHGLDWRRMGAAHGVAGSPSPEAPGVFACESREEADFFIGMARTPVDVWAIRVDGLWIESGPDGWLLIPDPVGPERLKLVDADLPPGRRD